MDLDEIGRLVQEAEWFSRLGRAETRPGLHAVTSVKAWVRYVIGSVRADFNLPGAPKPGSDPLWEMDWLPTSPDEQDPIHGDALKSRAEALGKADELRAVRLEMHKRTQISLRRAADHPLLHIGATDLTLAARGAALFACRMAASEAVVDEPGFWCTLLPIYKQGNWPMGTTTAGEIVVL